MGNKHSPVPWREAYGVVTSGGEYIIRHGMTDHSTMSVAGREQGPNMRRIVACVNACEGLDLPADVPVGALRDVVEALRETRAALDEAIGIIEASGEDCGDWEIVRAGGERALAALGGER